MHKENELITRAGFSKLQKLNEAALLGILLDARKKLETSDKIQKKKLMQHYTNIGVRAFARRIQNNIQKNLRGTYEKRI